MAYNTNVRQQILAYIKTNSVRDASKSFNVPYQTIYNWLKSGNFQKSYKVDDDLLVEFVKSNPDISKQDLANHFGVCESTMRQSLKRVNLYTRKHRETEQSLNRTRMTKSFIKKFIDESEGLITTAELSEKLDISPDSVNYYLRKFGATRESICKISI